MSQTNQFAFIYSVLHERANQAIPRDQCLICGPPNVCAAFYTLSMGNTTCGCGCPWYSHEPIADVPETIVANMPFQKGPLLSSRCAQYFSDQHSWADRPACVCGGSWQSHARVSVQFPASTGVPPRPTHPGAHEMPSPTIMGGQVVVPTFNRGFLPLARHAPGPQIPVTLSNLNPSSITANFTRIYRARAAFATVPPRRQNLIGRAMAPKTVPATRSPRGIGSLQANVTSGKKGKRTPRAISALANMPDASMFDLDVAMIPIPLAPVSIESTSPQDLRLLDMERHRELLNRLHLASLVFNCTFPFYLSGCEFVTSFHRQVLDHLTAIGAVLPSAPMGVSSNRTASNGEIDIHALEFRLLELPSSKRFKITTNTEGLNAQVLSQAPFGVRIPNTLGHRSNGKIRTIVFIAPSHGLLGMPFSSNHILLNAMKVSGNLALDLRPHPCFGPRLLNGFINNLLSDPDEALWECSSTCPSRMERLSDGEMDTGLPAQQTIQRINTSGQSPEATSENYTIGTNKSSHFLRDAPTYPRLGTAGTSRPRIVRRRPISSPVDVIEIDSSDSPTPPPRTPQVSFMVLPNFNAQNAREQGSEILANATRALHRECEDRTGSLLTENWARLHLRASTIASAAEALKHVLLRHSALKCGIEPSSLPEFMDLDPVGVTWSNGDRIDINDLFDRRFAVSLVGPGHGTFGDAIRASALTSLVKSLTAYDTLWLEDSQGYRLLQPSAPRSSVGELIGGLNDAGLNRVHSYAAGVACALLIVHTHLPPPVSPLLLAASMLMRPDRTVLIEPQFLKLLYPNEPIVVLFEQSSPNMPLTPLLPYIEAGDIQGNYGECPRDREDHDTILFATAMAFFGVTGLCSIHEADDRVSSAFVRGMLDMEIRPRKTLRLFLPSDPTGILQVVVALYNRNIVDVGDFIEHIGWDLSNISNAALKERFQNSIHTFLRGHGVPPLAAFAVSTHELHGSTKNPCYRAKRLLEACTGSELEPVGKEVWIQIKLVAPPPFMAPDSETFFGVKYRACMGSMTMYLTPFLVELLRHPDYFEAFLFQNLIPGSEYSREL